VHCDAARSGEMRRKSRVCVQGRAGCRCLIPVVERCHGVLLVWPVRPKHEPSEAQHRHAVLEPQRHTFAPSRCILDRQSLCRVATNLLSTSFCATMAHDGASSISVTVRVRPFTIREAAQLSKCDDQALFLGDGSLAAAPTPKLSSKGIKPVIKVLDEKCL
jgi:hypothetical protein